MRTRKPRRHQVSAANQKSSRVASRRGTGPRTKIGKERSKYNALKHGLYAKAILLSHENRSQYDDLHRGLHRDLAPNGTLEDVVVEKIATILWRHRRLLQAESAIVQENIEAQEAENARLSREISLTQKYSEKAQAETDRRGVIPEIDDYPESLEYCLDKLITVGCDADRYGLEHDTNKINLGLVYGARYSGRTGNDLFDYYLGCLSALKATAAERASKGFKSEADCENKFIAAVEKEIHRLEGHRKRPVQKPVTPSQTDEVQPRATELLELEIPKSAQLERLLHYEANLERLFDRALIQLERLQRMRDNQRTIEIAHQIAASD